MNELFRTQLTKRFIDLRQSKTRDDLDRDTQYLRGFIAGLYQSSVFTCDTYCVLMDLTTNVWNNRFDEFCAQGITNQSGVPF